MWWGVFKILQYSEMECNCVRKITEELLRKNSTLWQHKCESPNNIAKNNIHLSRRPPKFWGPRLQPIEPIGKSGTDCFPSPSIINANLYCIRNCHTVWKWQKSKDIYLYNYRNIQKPCWCIGRSLIMFWFPSHMYLREYSSGPRVIVALGCID